MFSPSKGVEGHGGTTIIARGVKLEGEFNSQSDVLIEGEVHGTLSTSGLLTVGPDARIKADVSAGEAIVSGTVEGNFVVSKRLEIKSSSKILGDVSAETITVESGAILSGRMMVGTKGTAPEKSATGSSRRERNASAATTLLANER
ncbi:polymer-forming cytoskeletal protein [Candidatus Uhrbacteria bacterium]|nr:polymer-forming cytoskeletal protein [Candidatus Uhrbacteria bacterium]